MPVVQMCVRGAHCCHHWKQQRAAGAAKSQTLSSGEHQSGCQRARAEVSPTPRMHRLIPACSKGHGVHHRLDSESLTIPSSPRLRRMQPGRNPAQY